MPGYPTTDSEKRLSADGLRRFGSRVFTAVGMSEPDATLLSDTLVSADLRGIHSHGVIRVAEYVQRLTVGGVNPQGRPEVVRDHGAAIVIDGGNSMGQFGSVFAMQKAIDRAREIHVAVAAVRGSNHCGALEYYTRMATAEDMIGLVTTNALPTMAPWGGVEKLIGINPLAVSIPAQHEVPISYDAAFSASSHGKIRVYGQKNVELPTGWATDRHGRPTVDPREAIEGLLLPIGEYKGYALALLAGLLATQLSEASFGTELGNMQDGPRAGADGHFFLVINIAGFTDVDAFKQRVDRIIREIRDSRCGDGVERIMLPGQFEAETAESYQRDGIPLNAETLASLQEIADQYGLPGVSDAGA